MEFRNIVVAAALFVAPLIGAGPAGAAGYPSHAVRLLVGFSPGGGADTIARILARKLTEKWGQPVVVENRPGADGTIAEDIVAHAIPDGYTIIMVINNHTIAPSQVHLSYDPVSSFAPISLVASSPAVLAVSPSLGVSTVKDFIALAKSRPGELNFGTSGTGTLPYLQMELLMSMTGIDLTNVPYKGSNLAQVGLLGGEIQALFGSITNYVELGKAGRVKVLAVSSKARAAVLPELPTISESTGLDYDVTGWYGVLAPAKTPPDVVAALHDSIAEATNSPDMLKILTDQGFTAVASTPAELDQIIRKELVSWAALLKVIDHGR